MKSRLITLVLMLLFIALLWLPAAKSATNISVTTQLPITHGWNSMTLTVARPAQMTLPIVIWFPFEQIVRMPSSPSAPFEYRGDTRVKTLWSPPQRVDIPMRVWINDPSRWCLWIYVGTDTIESHRVICG